MRTPAIASTPLRRAASIQGGPPSVVLNDRIERSLHGVGAVASSSPVATGPWRSSYGEDAPVEFSFDQIDHLVKEIDAHESAWSEFFDRAGVAPLHVVYEALEQNMKSTVVAILRFLDVDPMGVRIEPRTTRLRDTLNEEWGKEYGRLAAGHVDQ